jgi:hypothetical protein
MTKQQISDFALPTLLILENLFLYVFHDNGMDSQTVNAFGFFLCSVAFGIVLIYNFYKTNETEETPKPAYYKYIIGLLFACATVVLLLNTAKVIRMNKIDAKVSDIIPTIQVLVGRLRHHLNPYAYGSIECFGYKTPSGYLPMHWMPFLAADVLKFDYRWIPYIIWSIAVLVLCIRNINNALWKQVLFLVFAAGTYYMITQLSSGIIAITIETMVAGYYMLCIVGLNNKNSYIQGLLISFCLLSRYMLALWLPLWAFVLLSSGYSRSFLKSALTITVIVSAMYVIPFLSKDWGEFFASLHTYQSYSINEWHHLNGNGLPMHLYNGFGFAYLFYEKYIVTDVQQGYELLKMMIYIVLSIAVVIMGIWYRINRSKIDHRIFLMASLKIYLALFLAFIIVPYQYLMITANFVSMAIYIEQARYKLKSGI